MEKDTQEKKPFLEKLKEKWALKSIFQVVMVIIVFSITGMTVVFTRHIIFHWLGFDDTTPLWIKTVAYLLLIFPQYQILILVYGTLLGQFSFFWEKEKKLGRAIARPFRSKK